MFSLWSYVYIPEGFTENEDNSIQSLMAAACFYNATLFSINYLSIVAVFNSIRMKASSSRNKEFLPEHPKPF